MMIYILPTVDCLARRHRLRAGHAIAFDQICKKLHAKPPRGRPVGM
jgi:hypothetical protein